MTLSRLTLWTVAGLFLFTFGCMMTPPVVGNGDIVKEDRVVAGFGEVSVSGSGLILIVQGDTEGLQIEADANLLPYIESKVSGDHLIIRQTQGNLRFSQRPVYRLQLKELNSLGLSGALEGRIGHLESDQLKTSISGSGKVSIDRLDCPRLDAGISGSGKVEIGELNASRMDASVSGSGTVAVSEGSTGTLKMSISGSGHCRTPNLKTENAEVSLSGSGSGLLWVTRALYAKISGSGRIEYYGSPTVELSVSGSGKVQRLGEKP